MDEIGKTGQITRKYYQRRLPNNTEKDYYFIHRNTGKTQPVLIEYGFLDNQSDAQRLNQNYEKYAEAVVRAVSEYAGINYIPNEGENVYVVQKGDSLWSIARKFDISVSDLRTYNNLNNDNLQIGQILLIPNNTANENIYTVQKGDSLWSIANRFNVTVDELKTINNLTSNLLSVGQNLKIPSKTTNDTNSNYLEYYVKNGDSLWSIANRYNTTVDELINLNNLSTTLLSIGQILKIPSSNQYLSYIVQRGDSLWSIARKFETTVNEIKSLNSLTNNLLSIGQELKIPSKIQ